STPSPEDLPRVNAYIGLDRLPFPKSLKGKEILNFPLTIGRVTFDDPNFVIPTETPDVPSPEGVVFPDVREILISSTISTVAEVRVLDFGMERCHVSI
ncbi:uncharacterized protein STEHIDRAFT_33169, partial [Stereum hirsutum FP-91666 SS1]|uniref:uncharacterized protein n=1 Tax=Stereum hirsutum (strain FP-91666) TaxID=721885 RepID=UPI0004449408